MYPSNSLHVIHCFMEPPHSLLLDSFYKFPWDDTKKNRFMVLPPHVYLLSKMYLVPIKKSVMTEKVIDVLEL